MISRVDRVSHPFDSPWPVHWRARFLSVFNSRCPEKTGETRKIYRIVFIACDESFNMSSASTSGGGDGSKFVTYWNMSINYWISISEYIECELLNLILFEAIFYWPFYFCMREMYNSTFVYLKNFVLLYFWIPDSGFRIPDSRSGFPFRIPDSGFRIPVFGFQMPVSGFRLLGLPCSN